MTPWLALSLGLWLGQTPQVTPSLPPDADTQDPAALELREAWERALAEAEATDAGQDPDDTLRMPALEIGAPDSDITVPVSEGVPRGGTEEVEQLRAQLEALQTQLQTQQEEATTRTEAVEQNLTGMQERAQELERLRDERLELLERAGLWLLAADQALAVGELDVGDALSEVDTALTDALDNASDAGSGQSVLLVESARTRLAFALDAVGRRDVLDARQALYFASLELREARRHALDRPETSVVMP
jgi:hypothetical protein